MTDRKTNKPGPIRPPIKQKSAKTPPKEDIRIALYQAFISLLAVAYDRLDGDFNVARSNGQWIITLGPRKTERDSFIDTCKEAVKFEEAFADFSLIVSTNVH